MAEEPIFHNSTEDPNLSLRGILRPQADYDPVNGVKHCTQCNTIKTHAEFNHLTYLNGKIRCRSICRNCASASATIRANKRRTNPVYRARELFRERGFKQKAVDILGGVCFDCGEQHLGVLQFHHRDPEEKLFEIVKAVKRPRQYSWDEITREISKCDLLCANCHFKRHWIPQDNVLAILEEQGYQSPSGRGRSYLGDRDFDPNLCKRGHDLSDPENVWRYGNTRVCKQCEKIRKEASSG